MNPITIIAFQDELRKIAGWLDEQIKPELHATAQKVQQQNPNLYVQGRPTLGKLPGTVEGEVRGFGVRTQPRVLPIERGMRSSVKARGLIDTSKKLMKPLLRVAA